MAVQGRWMFFICSLNVTLEQRKNIASRYQWAVLRFSPQRVGVFALRPGLRPLTEQAVRVDLTAKIFPPGPAAEGLLERTSRPRPDQTE
jgi:hypothetical protein